MSSPTAALIALGQALSSMALYGAGHPARQRTLELSREAFLALLAADAAPEFTFIEGEVIYRGRVLRDLGDWGWARRLERAGIQRIEVTGVVSNEVFERFVADLTTQMGGDAGGDVSASAPVVEDASSPIRFGALGVRGVGSPAAMGALALATISYSLEDEAQGIAWLQTRVAERGEVPLLEAEVVVRSLALAMRSQGRIVLPLFTPRTLIEYAVTHASNVAVLVMALSEYLGLSDRDVRALGVAGLLHDIGNATLPKDLLTKASPLSQIEHKVIRRHPAEGARLLLAQHRSLDLAAVTAFEHHLLPDGSGYPELGYARRPHFASRMVRICDVYDALCSDRPTRAAWTAERALAEIQQGAGPAFDSSLVSLFVRMITESAVDRLVLPVSAAASAGP